MERHTSVEQFNALVYEATMRIPSEYTILDRNGYAYLINELRKRLHLLKSFRITGIYPISFYFSQEHVREAQLQINLEKVSGYAWEINPEDMEELDSFSGEDEDYEEDLVTYTQRGATTVAFLSLKPYAQTSL